MTDNRQEQIEALEVLKEFNERLLKNIPILVKELRGERLDDTDAFQKGVIDAMNWEIQVVNGTTEVLNENEERINKEWFNSKIVALAHAIEQKEDEAIAQALEDVIPCFTKLGEAAKIVTE